MDSSKDLEENLNDFKRMTSNLDDIDHTIEDETQAIILSNSLCDKYKDVKYGIMYGMDTLNFDIVISSLRSKDLEI